MKYTMKDVSHAAGVSVATISHVINNTKYVTEDVRKKVLKTIKLLNYQPNITARNFKMGKRQTIGFVVPDISNIFFSTLINEVERVVSKRDYMLIVVNTQENPEKELKQLRRMSSGLVDGLIVASTLDDYNQIKDCIPSNFPILFLDRKLNNCSRDTIIISNYNAVYKGVEKLLKNGHRKIGCVTGYQHLSTLGERLHAYQDCLIEHDIEVDQKVILQVDIINKNIIQDIERFFSSDITAAIFLNNTLTMDAYFYMINNREHVNKEIEIVGYSDDTWHRYAVRSMDIINQPVSDMGSIAGKRIIERIANPEIEVNNIILQANFIKKRPVNSFMYPYEIE
jgi:LacI family transcriptional regulator